MIIVKNVMEELVFEKINDIIGKLGCCTCDRCKADIAAITLNSVKAKYVATEKGELMSKVAKLSCDSDVDILSHIVAAAEITNKFPRH